MKQSERDTVQEALDALKAARDYPELCRVLGNQLDKAIAALEAVQVEPYAWAFEDINHTQHIWRGAKCPSTAQYKIVALYATPQQSAEQVEAVPIVQHFDDVAVDEFAKLMKHKLAEKREQGKHGWQDPTWTPEQITQDLLDHVGKGDPVDVANYCMFLSARGEGLYDGTKCSSCGGRGEA